MGYCFSASLPPLLAVAASEALHIVDREPERLQALARISRTVHDALRRATSLTQRFRLGGAPEAPLKLVHCTLDDPKQAEQLVDGVVQKVSDSCCSTI